jgi:D-proline reductase (dithiol) PrdB
VSLAARHLEANGLPTVIVGSALDIVEHCGVPRFVFTDFPLGNPCGKPYDAEMQRIIVETALDLLENATAPRTTVQTPFVWSEDSAWRTNYMKVDDTNREALAAAGEARRAAHEQARREGRLRPE